MFHFEFDFDCAGRSAGNDPARYVTDQFDRAAVVIRHHTILYRFQILSRHLVWFEEFQR